MGIVNNITLFALTGFLFLSPGNASAQSVDKKAAAVIELGASGGASLKGGGGSFGASVAVEVTPIENWLEIESGTSYLFGSRSTEWDTGVLFKKPWTISKKKKN